MDELDRLPRLEPNEALDARVRRRMRDAIEAENGKGAAPYLPFERALYTALAVAYAVYATANAVQLLYRA